MKYSYIVTSDWEPRKYEIGGIKLVTFREPNVSQVSLSRIDDVKYRKELKTTIDRWQGDFDVSIPVTGYKMILRRLMDLWNKHTK